MNTIELKDREIIDVLTPKIVVEAGIRHFGVALDNDEAQLFIKKGLRVSSDDDGPYLVVRIPSGNPWPFVLPKVSVDVTVVPQPWAYLDQTGIICWLKEFK